MNLRSPMATKVLGTLALLALAAAGWLLLLAPKTATLADTRTRIQDTQDQNALMTQQLATLRAQAEDLPQTREVATALAALFPPTADQPGLFRAVNAAARRAGIAAKDVTSLSPSPPTLSGVATGTDPAAAPVDPGTADLAVQAVSVSFEGSYEQTRRLLANLEAMDRAFLIGSVSLTAGSGSPTLVTTIGGDMFVMPPAADPEAVSPDSPSSRG